MKSVKVSDKPLSAPNPKAAVPIILFTFVFCLVIDNGFKFMTKPIAEDLGLSLTTASLQATLAGIVIGIGAVVYAALADSISMRKLLVAGIVMIAAGSAIGFAFQGVWELVLAGRIIQTCGLAAAETLYVIYVTKYLSKDDQKTYLGFSTSAFQGALLIGTLTSGIMATYVSWTAMFLVSLLLVAAIPVILKKVPDSASVRSHLDVFGLFLIAVVATAVMMFMQAFAWPWAVVAVIGIVVFAWHVRTHDDALVTSAFFANGRYVTVLAVVLVVYSVQLGYSAILLPHLADKLHGINIDGAAYILAPGYALAVVVGALSGKVGKVLSSRNTIIAALLLIMAALIIPALFVGKSVAIIVISMLLFPSGFALIYAPLVATAVGGIPPEKSGVAIGFYNLVINIAVPVGIAYTAKLVDLGPTFLSGLSPAGTDAEAVVATVLWILAALVVVGLIIYLIADGVLSRREARAATAEEKVAA